jgi:hypothetical protein
MKGITVFCLCAALLASFTQQAFAWGSVSGPNGGSAYRGPMGAGAVHGPNGGSAYRAPTGTAYRGGGAYYGGGYHPYPAAGVAAGVATGVVVGSAAASAYRPPAYYAPPVVAAPACGYYPYPPCY